MKTKTVAEVLELNGVNNIGISAILILNQQLEANKICVVDRQKASKIISDSLLELVFNGISDYDLRIITNKISDRITNCVKFREGVV
jgi:hypothetical protein